MAVALSPEVQRRIEEQLTRSGFSSPDDLVLHALNTLDQLAGEPLEDLDPQTQEAIAEGLAQADRGEGRPWADVREELRTRFTRK
jgi:predicted transcriptional regulator